MVSPPPRERPPRSVSSPGAPGSPPPADSAMRAAVVRPMASPCATGLPSLQIPPCVRPSSVYDSSGLSPGSPLLPTATDCSGPRARHRHARGRAANPRMPVRIDCLADRAAGSPGGWDLPPSAAAVGDATYLQPSAMTRGRSPTLGTLPPVHAAGSPGTSRRRRGVRGCLQDGLGGWDMSQ